MRPFFGGGIGYPNIMLIVAGIILICIPPFVLFPILGVGLLILAFLPRGIFRR